MRPFEYPLLADENIAPEVIEALRARGCDVHDTREEELVGQRTRLKRRSGTCAADWLLKVAT